MRAARFALFAIALLGTLLATSAAAAPPGAPKGLRGFELRPNESSTHTFSRTPAFAWSPVRGASCYEFELATSRSFDGSSVFWSNVSSGATSGKFCRAVTVTAPAAEDSGSDDATTAGSEIKTRIAPIRIPATSVNLVLPWFTGKPYALWAHVRAVTTRGATAWSKPFGFNVRWESTPVPQPAKPGLVRWKPVEGATAYDVWYPDIRKVIRTHTNVADQRELYTFHLEDSWWQLVRWRVRPVRQVVGALPNGLPAVSYGPWSPTYATQNPAWAAGKLQVRAAISDVVSTRLEGRGASADAGDDVRRRHGSRRPRVSALPHVRLHRSRLRKRRLPRLGGRRSCVRTARLRAAQASDEPGGARRRARRHPPERQDRDREDIHGRRLAHDRERGIRCRRSRSCRPSGRRHVVDPLLLDGRPGRDHRRRGRHVHVLRRRIAAGRMRVGTHGELRQGVAAGASRPPERRTSPGFRQKVACWRKPDGALLSIRRLSSRGDPWSARRHTRCSGRERSTRGGRADPPSRTRRHPCSSSAPVSGTTASAD